MVIDKLNFLTAGMPLATGKGSYKEAFGIIKDLNLDGMELEFVHGVRMSQPTQKLVDEIRKTNNFVLTAHAPFYINLNSKEEEKIEASIKRIVETLEVANNLGAYSITFHAAFYMNMEKDVVFTKVANAIEKIVKVVEEKNINVWIRPETTGKSTQWGDLDEIIRLSKLFKGFVLPCVDFSHLHARSNGEYNTYSEFAKIFEQIGNELGQKALNNFHAHIACIEYGVKGEKKHLNFVDADMNYKDLIKAFKDFKIKGAITCESPNIEEDALLLKEHYLSL